MRFADDDTGATSIEYALIATFLFFAIIAALSLVGTNLNATFSRVANQLNVS